MKGFLIFPVLTHTGHGSWDNEGTYNHFIHHTKFYWNYGNSPFWDRLMGTNYDEEVDGEQDRTEESASTSSKGRAELAHE